MRFTDDRPRHATLRSAVLCLVFIATFVPSAGAAGAGGVAGYWVARADGAVHPFGTAESTFGPASVIRGLRAPIVGIAARPSRDGYWLVAADGGVFAFGHAPFFGSLGGRRLAAPIVGIAATGDGNGYWLVGRDGGIFSFGDAQFAGSAAGTRSQPFVSIAGA